MCFRAQLIEMDQGPTDVIAKKPSDEPANKPGSQRDGDCHRTRTSPEVPILPLLLLQNSSTPSALAAANIQFEILLTGNL